MLPNGVLPAPKRMDVARPNSNQPSRRPRGAAKSETRRPKPDPHEALVCDLPALDCPQLLVAARDVILDRLLDVSTVARLLQVSDETVRVWIRRDKIAFERVAGGKYRIRSSELARLRNSQKSQSNTR